MNKKHTVPTVFGASSLLVIFSVLCLVVFALLSLSTAGAGERLSKISAKQVESYFAADAQAEDILAKIRAGEMPDDVTKNGDIYTYSCTISNVMKLCVEVKADKNGNYDVIKWQSVRTASWQAEDSLTVWNPNNQ